MAQIPKGGIVKGPYKPICTDCAIYFSITVPGCRTVSTGNLTPFSASLYLGRCPTTYLANG